MRTAKIERSTAETDIKLGLNIDGKGISEINSGCGFLDHMLTLLAKHGRFDLDISCKGDTAVDYHHTTEDIGICLGQAFAKALADKKGINRYGSVVLPMDGLAARMIRLPACRPFVSLSSSVKPVFKPWK